ncbi:thiosulfate sulfurtransferase/rhodanese-like domain-containing protein 1 [Orbicella faveolata]|uniref:thiosulfate sulfurtransferase/rhodanese-like domain-containing protein 1 n=1 Tax=Orbicella faveolata TaxID=48498 RepID=UPI0009E1A3C8|nr:thiosulfate sulfurtransferase/rhodanese-like domain-containing protein 1 [Orbicella faveolata]
MASRAVARLTKSVLSESVIPRVLIAKALSANAGPKERIWSCSKEADQSQIGLECLKDMVIDGDIQLFDVREPHELASLGKIPKSVNIPLSQVVEAFSLSPAEFEQKYGVQKPDVKDDNLIFHCQSGRRAKKAMESVKELGFDKATHFSRVWSEWEFYIKRRPQAVQPKRPPIRRER